MQDRPQGIQFESYWRHCPHWSTDDIVTAVVFISAVGIAIAITVAIAAAAAIAVAVAVALMITPFVIDCHVWLVGVGIFGAPWRRVSKLVVDSGATKVVVLG